MLHLIASLCITIVSCYCHTNTSDESDIINLYDELLTLARHIPKHLALVIGRDVNAQIGKDEDNRFCLHNLPNRNDEVLTDFLLENSFSCLNIKFQKREGNNGSTSTQMALKHSSLYIHKQEVDKLRCELCSMQLF